MAFWQNLLQTFTGGGAEGGLADTLLKGADQLFTSKEEKAAAKRMALAAQNEHIRRMTKMAQEAEKMHLEDVQGAREMQMEALRQKDRFSKRFVYVLATLVILGAFSFGVALMYVEIPPENKRLVEMFADIFLFSGAVMVLQFFFGSSRSSDDKNKDLAALAERGSQSTKNEEKHD
mgnify:CR=1 FL=1